MTRHLGAFLLGAAIFLIINGVFYDFPQRDGT